MKNKFFNFSIIMLAVAVMIFVMSCKDEPELSLSVQATDIIFSPDGASATAGDSPITPTFTVETNQGKWDVATNVSWLTASKSETGFTLSAEGNTAFTPREANVLVIAGNATAIRIHASQQSYAQMISSTEDVTINQEGTAATAGTMNYTVMFNFTWEAVPSQTWLTVNATGTGFTLSTSANNGLTRNATVAIIRDGVTLIEIPVKQDGLYGDAFLLDKSLWSKVELLGDNTIEYSAPPTWQFSSMWDGIVGDQGYHQNGGPIPNYFTIDLGVTAKLATYTLWQRLGGYEYTVMNLKKWKIYGTSTLSPSDDMDYWTEGFKSDWVLLADCYSYRPSGLDTGDPTEEDQAYAALGFTFDIPDDAPPVRYIRHYVEESWIPGYPYCYVSEISLWGGTVE